jgi:hypothetical protein
MSARRPGYPLRELSPVNLPALVHRRTHSYAAGRLTQAGGLPPLPEHQLGVNVQVGPTCRQSAQIGQFW